MDQKQRLMLQKFVLSIVEQTQQPKEEEDMARRTREREAPAAGLSLAEQLASAVVVEEEPAAPAADTPIDEPAPTPAPPEAASVAAAAPAVRRIMHPDEDTLVMLGAADGDVEAVRAAGYIVLPRVIKKFEDRQAVAAASAAPTEAQVLVEPPAAAVVEPPVVPAEAPIVAAPAPLPTLALAPLPLPAPAPVAEAPAPPEAAPQGGIRGRVAQVVQGAQQAAARLAGRAPEVTNGEQIPSGPWDLYPQHREQVYRLWRRWESLTDPLFELANQHVRMQELVAQNEILSAENRRLAAQNARTNTQLEESQRQVNEALAELKRLTSELRNAQAETLRVLGGKIDGVNTNISNFRLDLQALNRRFESIERELGLLRQNLPADASPAIAALKADLDAGLAQLERMIANIPAPVQLAPAAQTAPVAPPIVPIVQIPTTTPQVQMVPALAGANDEW